MADTVTPEERSRTMRAVKSRDTKPELVVRRLLHAMGCRFRLHRKDLPGNPDIVLPRHKKVIFVHGCFWHGHPGCKHADRPSSNTEYWHKKIDRNMERDQRAQQELAAQHWRALIVWECQTRDRKALTDTLGSFLETGARAINLAEDDRVSSVERMVDGKLPAEEVVP